MAAWGPRIQVIEWLLSSAHEPEQDIGILALGEMLRTQEYWSSSREESFGARMLDEGWTPASVTDPQHWYGEALGVVTRWAVSASPHRTAVRKLLADRLQELWGQPDLVDQVEQVVLDLAADQHWPDAWLAAREKLAWSGEHMDEADRCRLIDLIAKLVPVSLEERIRCYVLLPGWRIADTMRMGQEEDGSDPFDDVVSVVRGLGQEAAQHPEVIASLIDELVGPDAHQAFWLGEGLGQYSANRREIWDQVVVRYDQVPHRARNSRFLGGLLHAISAAERELANALLDDALADPRLAADLPLIQSMIPLDQAAFERLLMSIDSRSAPASAFRTISLGGALQAFPAEQTVALLRGIRNLPDGLPIAAGVLEGHLRWCRPQREQWPACLKVLGQEMLMDCPLDLELHQQRSRSWQRVAEECLSGADGAQAAAALCRRVRQAGYRALLPHAIGGELLAVIAGYHPDIALDCLLNSDKEGSLRAEVIANSDWRYGKLLRQIPSDRLLAWAQQDPDDRYVRIAQAVSPFVHVDGKLTWSEIAARLLDLAPDRAAVLAAFAAQIVVRNGLVSSATEYEERKRLVESVVGEKDQALQSVGRRIAAEIAKEIKWSRQLETSRDETFEL
jgi:hypothetical protein